MQIDNNIKKNLLSLDDKTLKNVVSSLAGAAGISESKIQISDSDLFKIRSAISRATDKDAEEALKVIGGDEKAQRIIEEARRKGGQK